MLCALCGGKMSGNVDYEKFEKSQFAKGNKQIQAKFGPPKKLKIHKRNVLPFCKTENLPPSQQAGRTKGIPQYLFFTFILCPILVEPRQAILSHASSFSRCGSFAPTCYAFGLHSSTTEGHSLPIPAGHPSSSLCHT